MLSVVIDRSLDYPDGAGFYSPDVPFPEYRFSHLAPAPNPVYRSVRRCFSQLGLDAENLNTPRWNPLGAWVPKSSRVFVLCNFVYHRRWREGERQMQAKCTHASVIRAVVDYLLMAVGSGGRVIFGNAPLQACRWDAVLEETGVRKVLEFYDSVRAPVEACDLRLRVVSEKYIGLAAKVGEQGCADDTVRVDLGRDSLLSPLDKFGTPNFRVTHYDPAETESFHGRTSHVYVLNRKVLGCDVVFSIPKLKTHEKVGLTGAVKGCVGVIANKACLAHHRRGEPSTGGDEYPRDHFHLLRRVSDLHEWVCRRNGRGRMKNSLRVLDRALQRAARALEPAVAGSWHGNDTAWRMASDIARIVAHYRDGGMQPAMARPHLALIDGVVGGDGAGPLKPRPVHSGVLVFSDNPVIADLAAALLVGFDPERLPIIREAFRETTYPLVDGRERTLVCNEVSCSLGELAKLAPARFQPPRGWLGKIENGRP